MTQLQNKLKNNDSASWEEFYNSHVNGIYRYVISRCENETLSEDIVQQVFLTAVDKIECFNGSDEKLSHWLWGIARVELMRHFRKQKSEKNYSYEDYMCEVVEPEVYEKFAEGHMIDHVLGNMAEDHRKVLTLKYMRGFSVKEISSVFERSNKAVESLLTRARESFKNIYNQIQKGGN